MTEVFVGVGSNVEPDHNVHRGLDALRERFGYVRQSTIWRSRAVGFDGNDFHNLVVVFETNLEAHALETALHDIETRCGRDRSAPRFSPRAIDLDLLLFGETIIDDSRLRLPRDEILKYAFVLRPLAELAGDRTHPVTGLTFNQHWQQFRNDEPPLVAVES